MGKEILLKTILHILVFGIIISNPLVLQIRENSDEIIQNNDLMISNTFNDDKLSSLNFNAILQNYSEIAQWDDNYGISYIIQIDGDLAYLTVNNYGFIIANISDTSNITIIGEYQTSAWVGFFLVDGDYVYITTIEDSPDLIILDIHNKANPVLLYSFTNDPPAVTSINIALYGKYLYFTTYTLGLFVFDITNKTNPDLVLTYNDIPRLNDIFIIDHYALVTEFDENKLFVLDLSNPVEPMIVTSLAINSRIMNSVINGNYMYLSTNDGLRIVDISDITHPSIIGTLLISSGGGFLTFDDNFLFVCKGDEGLDIIDVTTKSNPQIIATYNELGMLVKAAIKDNIAYITNALSGLIFLDICDKYSPIKIGEWNIFGNTVDVHIVDDYLFLADYFNGLRIFNISDLSNIQKTASVTPMYNSLIIRSYYNHIFVDENYVYFLSADGMVIFSVEDKTNPYYVSNYTYSGTPNEIFVYENYTYVIDKNQGLKIINTTNIMDPTLVGSSDSATSQYDVIVEDDFAYICESWGLRIVDLSNKALPVNTHYYSSSNCKDICLRNDIAFMSSDNGIEILNVTIKSSPSLLTTIENYYGKLSLENDCLFIAMEDDGLAVFNISNINSPTIIGTYYDGGQAMDVFGYNGIAFVADGLDDLEIIGPDSDNDKLADFLEINVYGTNTSNPDTDTDTITDGDEIYRYFSNPLVSDINLDTDSDTLSNIEEVDVYNTDPLNPDTDNDLLEDNEEINDYHTSPLYFDSDWDDLSDGMEVLTYSTNPLKYDSDNDNLNDYTELFITFTDPNDSDSDGDTITDFEEIYPGEDGYITNPNERDTDQDGFDDNIEIVEGTDPTNPNDYPISPTPTPTETPTTEKSSFIGSFLFTSIFTIITFVLVKTLKRKEELK
ncbi:MAG: hypothetical protein ACFFDW_08085 [Candidatus Thorarchaeota archaeon]